MPPSECVEQRKVTVRQRMSMSGWWLRLSAISPTRATTPIATGKRRQLGGAHERVAVALPAGQVLQRGVDRGVVEEGGHGPILALEEPGGQSRGAPGVPQHPQASRRSIVTTVVAAPTAR